MYIYKRYIHYTSDVYNYKRCIKAMYTCIKAEPPLNQYPCRLGTVTERLVLRAGTAVRSRVTSSHLLLGRTWSWEGRRGGRKIVEKDEGDLDRRRGSWGKRAGKEERKGEEVVVVSKTDYPQPSYASVASCSAETVPLNCTSVPLLPNLHTGDYTVENNQISDESEQLHKLRMNVSTHDSNQCLSEGVCTVSMVREARVCDNGTVNLVVDVVFPGNPATNHAS